GRAESRIRRTYSLRALCVVEPATGLLRDRGERLRVGWHLDRPLEPTEIAGDGPIRCPEGDRVDGDAHRLRPGGALERLQETAGLRAVGEEQHGHQRAWWMRGVGRAGSGRGGRALGGAGRAVALGVLTELSGGGERVADRRAGALRNGAERVHGR